MPEHLHIEIEGMRDVLGLLEGINQAQNAILCKLDDLSRKEDINFMAISDQLKQEDANLTAIGSALDGIAKGIADLDTLIQNFQNSPGVLSAADQAALDAIVAKSTAVAAQAAKVSTAPPAPPAPAPAP